MSMSVGDVEESGRYGGWRRRGGGWDILLKGPDVKEGRRSGGGNEL